MVTQQEQYDRLFGHILGHQATEIAAIGLRSGLFAALAGRPGMTGPELAASAELDGRYVSVWARSAFAHGFLDRTADDGFALAAHMGALLLDPTSPTYLGGTFCMESATDEDYRRFPALMATGQTWPRGEHDPEMLQALADGTTPDSVMLVEHVLPRLPWVMDRLHDAGAILEIGAGAGVHTARYATTFRTALIVALESDPASIALARRLLDEEGVGERVDVRQQDANQLDDRERFDLATMNLVLHETGEEEDWRNVLRRVFRALRPGGGIVVSELPYPDDINSYRSNPVHRRLAGIQLHETVVGCGAITEHQLLDLVGAAGFADVSVVDQPRSSRHVVIGTKPSN
jgi:predicted O-methyltransferase YrrM